MSSLRRDNQGQLIQALPQSGADAVVLSLTTAAAVTSSAAPERTSVARISVSGDCHVRVGATATTATAEFWPSGYVEFVAVSPGDTISAIRAGTNSITVNIGWR